MECRSGLVTEGEANRQSDNRLPGHYNPDVEAIRLTEYPHMSNGVYLDHSGATIYAKSTVDLFSRRMISDLYGNPHSENAPARLSGEAVDRVRARTLRFLGADPEHFDLVFVANATAAVKLVADAFRDLAEKSRARRFWYGFHKDAHTSLVGVRELTYGCHDCFESDAEVEAWLDAPAAARRTSAYPPGELGLFAYPGQSNMTGRRLPLDWCARIRRSSELRNCYTLFDAAALAMTSPMYPVFSDPEQAPDFTCLSLYKIFGFPDLGALVVRKQSGHILTLRKYFGGGTVTMVGTLGPTAWHRGKGLQAPTYHIHDGLEDGTLPFHSLIALDGALDVHARLYGSMHAVAAHAAHLTARLHAGLASLRHGNGRPVCRIYGEGPGGGAAADFADPARQGSVVAFNVLKPDGEYVSYAEVEQAANAAGIFIRSGGVCNPGGIFTALGYEPWMIERALSAGHHCGSHGISIIHGLPTGIVRASLGAMSTRQDVDALLAFLRQDYVVEEAEDTQCSSARSTLCMPAAAEEEGQPRQQRPPPPPPPAPQHYLPYPPAAAAAADPHGSKTPSSPDKPPLGDVRERRRPRKSSWRATWPPRPLPSLSRFARVR